MSAAGTPRLRVLSIAVATRCENATGGRCRCRCGGMYHGAARVQDLRTLPRDDPHAPAPPRERRARARKQLTIFDLEGV